MKVLVQVCGCPAISAIYVVVNVNVPVWLDPGAMGKVKPVTVSVHGCNPGETTFSCSMGVFPMLVTVKVLVFAPIARVPHARVSPL